jgi:hypothetical protein
MGTRKGQAIGTYESPPNAWMEASIASKKKKHKRYKRHGKIWLRLV